MANKLQLVSELANQTAHAVTHSADSWKRYLDTSARIYKYPFDEQLLIYAQRPDATACAGMELWNNTMRRWVRPGAKGIALIRKDRRGRPSLEYVFDVSDTRPVQGAKTPYLWELREDHHAAVLDALERQYGPAGNGDTGGQLMELAARAVNEVYRDRLTDLAYDVENSLLEELDGLNLEVRFRDVLTASVQYAVLTRCGLDPAEFMEDSDLAGITEFSTPAVLHHLGSAASVVSMELLNEIGRAVKTWDQEQTKNNKKNLETTLAISQEIGYTEDARKFNTVKRESKERSGEHGADLHESGRLPDPRPDDGRAGGRGENAPGQVRAAAADLPDGPSSGDVHVDAADRAAGAPPAGDRPAGAGAGGPDGGRSEKAERRGRSDESAGPDGLGTGGEQLHASGGGDRAERDRVPINQDEEQTAGDESAVSSSEGPAPAPFHLFPPVEKQAERIAQAQAEERQMSIPAEQVPESVIGRALTCGSNKQHSVERIVAFFQKGPAGSDAASFMEAEFGEGGKGVSIGRQDYALWFGKEGFRIAPGRTAFGPGSTLITWVNAAVMASNLLRNGMFADQEKIGAAEGNEYRELAAKLWYLRQDFSDSARERNLLPTVSQHFLGKGFPDDIREIAGLLKDPVSRQQIVRELAEFVGEYDKNPEFLRYRRIHNPQELLAGVVNLFTPRQEFHAAEGFAPARASFITEDEIDQLLLRGGSYEDSKFGIYSYFVRGHNAQECAQFLREAYGEGGFSYIGYDESHGGRGIKFTRGDDESGFKGYATVQLNWNQVQKRVRGLIDSGKYLSFQEKSRLSHYENRQLARRIYWFYQGDPNRTKTAPFDMDAPVNQILTVLTSEDRAAVHRLSRDMFNILAAVPPDSEAHRRMAPVLRDVEAFQRGEYSLFTPLPEAVLEAERQAKQAAKEARKAEREAQRAERSQRIPQARQGVPEEPEGRLAAAARALGKKMQPQGVEDDDGQMSFDLTSVPILEQHAPPAAEPAAPRAEPAVGRASDPVTLYRSILNLVDREVSRGGLGFDLREHTISYESGRAAISGQLNGYVDFAGGGDPETMAAYENLPMFREWLIEDLLERNYNGAAVDAPDGPQRHANDPDAPEWARGAPPVPKATYELWSAKGPIKWPDAAINPAGREETAEKAAVLGPDDPAQRSEAEPGQVEIDGGQIGQPEPPPRPAQVRHNFHITDDNLGAGGEKTKYRYNVAAIRTLKRIEAEGRLATPEEQEILSRYVGWGGIAKAFDPGSPKWAKEYAELKELLTRPEYELARGSALNAHYTSPTIIKAVYQALENMSFRPGTVLEPSMGVGNFFGLLPESMAGARLYGVELDSLSGRIARQLYPNAHITVAGFETTDRRDFFDLAVGQVPFGGYSVNDPAYNKLHLSIHNYFAAKIMDQLRPGGVAVFVTSHYTMDARNDGTRRYLAQRADLLGAVRLPNNALKVNAGTEVTTDILFFQKRDRPPEKLPEWVETGLTENEVPLNRYFLDHRSMVLGKMSFWKNMYGNEAETACLPIEGAGLSRQLAEAIQNLAPPDRELLELDAADERTGEALESLPADPDLRNFSFVQHEGKLYFRENSRMTRVELGKTPAERVKGMIAIRDCARRLIGLQLENAGDDEVKAEQANLNQLYDQFTKKYGLLNSLGNKMAFEQDASYPLLCSLEVLDEDGSLERKADMFTRRTIQNRRAVTSVDTAVEALAVSIGEKARVDLEYMASLMGGVEKIPQIVADLKGVIFKDPAAGPFDLAEGGENWSRGWQTADEYLSGDVRVKLAQARLAAENHPEFAVNVEKLEQVQPKDLAASEISVRIGASWIDRSYYQQFMYELCQTPEKLRDAKIRLMYSDSSGEWRVLNKSADSRDNVRVHTTYGTKRINAYEIFEAALNQRDVRIFDKKWVDGKETRVLNEKQTMIAQQKQEAIGEAFKDWIFKDPERREALCKKYNEMFNNIRPRAYDGSHINFVGMNPEISLRPHQRSAVAHILYGKNTLLAHCVGAGKTYEMAAAAMESKRLGLCQKSLFVVPNHLTEQWGGDFLRLYPGAKVLVATKKDFEPKRRRRFCARIATGDYDAVIIGHSQFEKIPLSPERQRAVIQDQIDEVMEAIRAAKEEDGDRFTIKQMEKTKKNLEARLEKLAAREKKDNVVTFEELGVDRLFVDEAHGFKNMFLHTKMSRVAGITQTDAQKSSDMFAKCRYMDEITGGRGITFATGTPISNSMVELFTMMRYLQFDTLVKNGHRHFDNWAADFGEKVTAMELKPEGTGFRSKTRFAKFYNLPELMSIWKEAADIQTADMLKLPVPEAIPVTVTTEPSAFQQEMVAELGERAEAVRDGSVNPREDNMLKITSDGRKLALDQRLCSPLLPDDPNSKVNVCVRNIIKEWRDSTAVRGTQLVFCDLSAPKGDGKFNVYDDIKTKLIAQGIPQEEISFIHDAGTDAQKAELFAKVRRGQVRVLIGSTQKMGAGTNVQDRIVASHDLDCPWRPADLEQRAGRSLRQGNRNQKVRMYKYVTKGTFDAYNWGLVENKQKFIGQIMTGKSPARSAEDVDATALSYAEVKALATGDDRIREKMDLDVQVAKLKMLKANHAAMQYEMQDKALKYYPQQMAETWLFIEALGKDLPIVQAHSVKDDAFTMTVMGQVFTGRKEAGEAIIKACMLMSDPEKPLDLGEYRGFPMQLHCDGSKFRVTMKRHLTYTAELSDDPVGNVMRINNALECVAENLERNETRLIRLESELKNAREEAERPFPKEEELRQKSARLTQLNRELEKPKAKMAEQSKSGDRAPDSKGGEAPARVPPALSVAEGGKLSIRQAIRDFNPPAPVPSSMEKGRRREAAL